MPILPPRNMPMSPRGPADKKETDGSSATPSSSSRTAGQTPRTPSSSRASRATTVSPSPTPSTPTGTSTYDASGQLSRNDETTFHRRLRVLLWDHRAAREAWEDMVSIQGAKSVAALSRLAAQLDDWLAGDRRTSKAPSTLPHILHLPQQEATARRAEEVAKLVRRLDDERDTLDVVLSRLDKLTSKLEALSDAAETLLVETTRAKGDVFTFQREAWTTWPMSRFVSTVRTLSARFSIQTDHLRLLSRIMLDQGCALGTASSKSDDAAPQLGKSQLDRDDDAAEDDDDDDDDEESDGAAKHDAATRKARALVRQRILEEWQALPMLRDSADGSDTARWFEDVCCAEVARWDER